MDIAGAKALKERLGSNGTARVTPAHLDVPEDAPPLFRWVGVHSEASENAAEDGADKRLASRGSLFPRRRQSSRK